MRKSRRIRKGLMVMLLIVSISIFLFADVTSADQWAKTYGNVGESSWANSIRQTSDGGYIVAGFTSANFWILKLNGSGDVQWQKTYGGTNSDWAYSIQQTSDGGYILAGMTDSFGAGHYDAWVLKLDGNGNVQWEKTYGGTNDDYAYSIQQTSDGGYIVVGGAGSVGAWVLKLDGNGNVVWQKSYEGYIFISVKRTSGGGYIVAGADFHGLWILRLDTSGNVVWQKAYCGTSISNWTDCIDQTTDGGYVVTGSNAVLKLDVNGNVQWQKSYGIVQTSIKQTSDGGYILAGFDSGGAYILKLDVYGDVQWANTYGYGLTYAFSIQPTSDNGYIVSGWTLDSERDDFGVLKLDSNGDIPNCSIIATANVTVNDISATVTDTTVTGINTSVSPQTSTASTTNTNATVTEVCYYEPTIHAVTCSFTPVGTLPIRIVRGGYLGFWATGSNDSDDSQTFQFATFVTLPPNGTGSKYPPSGWLFGPITVNLGPHTSKSKYLTQFIPYNAPFGTYTYHGYVGVVGPPPLLYNQCQFNFEVVP